MKSHETSNTPCIAGGTGFLRRRTLVTCNPRMPCTMRIAVNKDSPKFETTITYFCGDSPICPNFMYDENPASIRISCVRTIIPQNPGRKQSTNYALELLIPWTDGAARCLWIGFRKGCVDDTLVLAITVECGRTGNVCWLKMLNNGL